MIIEGVILSVIFQSEETGFHVLCLDNNIVAVGSAPLISVGSEYRFTGEYVRNAKYGVQFAFSDITLMPPNTKSKILAFLSGGLIAGVRDATAKKIVNKFGLQSLSVLESDPKQLAKIKGISMDKAMKIGESYAAVRDMQAVIMWLHKFGLGLTLTIRIYKYYGDATIETVARNPYALIETIDGIGFLTADNMAKILGVTYNGTFRVRAGVVHILKVRSERDGDTFVTLENLLDEIVKLLEISRLNVLPTFNTIIDDLCVDRIVVSVECDGQQGIQLIKFFNAEKSIAQKLLILSRESTSPPNVDVLIEHYEKLKGITFHDTQKAAIRQAVTSGVTVITGGPGTGKTTIINAILYINQSNDLTTQLLAPTGRAAKRIEESTGHEAMTIHRCLDIDYKNLESGNFKYVESKNFIKKDSVIVDEVSMCDCLLTASLLRKIMHGTKVVLIGDVDQLPSVGAGNVLFDLISSHVLPVVRLTQIYRTGETATIAINAHKINNGEMPLLDNKSSDFFHYEAENPADIKNIILNLYSTHNFGLDASKIQVLAPMKSGEAGVISLNKVLQEKLNPAGDKIELVYGDTIFRVDDRVMNIVNNYNQEWVKNSENGKGIFNGDIGKIIDINKYSGEVTVALEDGRVTIYSRSELSALTLSYAITVHKSQGCEFDAVVIPVVAGAYMILTRNLLYTAVTRAKKIVVLVGSTENIRRMVNSTCPKKRNSCLSKYLQVFRNMPYL